MMAFVMLGFVCAVMIGIYEGSRRLPTLFVVLSGIAIMGVSTLAASWPWFTDDPGTWMRTYLSGLVQTGSLWFVVHVLPFVIAYFIARRLRGDSASNQD